MKGPPLSIRPFRRTAQAGVALLFAVVPALNRMEITALSGNFFFFNIAGIPLADPLSVLQVAAGAFSVTTAMCAGAGLALLLALLMGPVFCSWLCPYGFFSELAHALGAKRASGTTFSRSASFASKLLIVCVGLLAVFLFAPVPLLNQLSMPGWYSRAMQHAVFYREALACALIFPALLAAEFLSGRRFWCLYLCPQSVLISLAGALLPGRLRVRFSGRSCTCAKPERPCRARCSLGLDPRSADLRQRLQCSNCGDCVDACRKNGRALRFSFGRDA
ncbi:MAG: 4Fe-4S binding protein [Desulfovibrio sp.]|jgi:ferredoxin-type protein NapH|nr:4Fe-4S binding protein [Desulfovibrio sp.]